MKVAAKKLHSREEVMQKDGKTFLLGLVHRHLTPDCGHLHVCGNFIDK